MRRHFKRSALLIALVALAGLASALVCRDREDQAALAEAICAIDKACRFEIIDNPRLSGNGASWQARLRERLAATPSMRARFVPASWLIDPQLEWSVAAADDNVTNCTALAEAVAAYTAVPPPAALLFVAAWVQFEAILADDAHCNDVNEVAVLSPDGVLTCQCLPGKHCRLAGVSVTDTLLIVTGVVVIVVAVAVFVSSILQVRRQAKR